ncbi:hypothetical protein VNO78_30946 [Psophocarpus tetragonolobus]|uniref:Uncharacterized protein n=1 Tax=Psophocarpus tetragonolobus TaxID=3891 RepID=A0AAN9RXQ7_PSOTE
MYGLENGVFGSGDSSCVCCAVVWVAPLQHGEDWGMGIALCTVMTSIEAVVRKLKDIYNIRFIMQNKGEQYIDFGVHTNRKPPLQDL